MQKRVLGTSQQRRLENCICTVGVFVFKQNNASGMEVKRFISSDKQVYYLQNRLPFSRNEHCGCQSGDSLCLIPLAGGID